MHFFKIILRQYRLATVPLNNGYHRLKGNTFDIHMQKDLTLKQQKAL